MALLWSSYYGLIRINELGPEAKGWAVTDTNFQSLSLIMKALEQHQHGGATPVTFPGYNPLNTATPATPTLREVTTGGSLSPGTSLGVRLSFVDRFGLETDGSPETIITLSPQVGRPTGPIINDPVATPVPGAVAGGGYVYALTKRRGTSETDISDVATINVPYDPVNTYTVTLNFDPITFYSDGTDSIRIYRASGYNSALSLLKTIATPITTYTDNGTIEDPNAQPPTSNQFNQFEKVNIDWTAIPIPQIATRFRIYVTRDIGQWGINHLFQDYDLSTPLGTNVDFLGSEVLAKGWPLEFTQCVSAAPRVNLRTGATGGFTLTDVGNFAGFQSYKFVLADDVNNATPIDGGLYYDRSARVFKGRVAGTWQNFATPFVGQAGGAGFIHSVQEQGGHEANNIRFNLPPVPPYGQGGQASLAQILNVVATPVVNFRKNVTKVFKAPTPSTPTSTNTSASTYLDLDTGPMSVDYAGQQMEVIFNGHFYSDTPNATFTTALEVDGVKIEESVRSTVATATPGHMTMSTYFATPATISNTRVKVLWWISQGTVVAASNRRTLVGKVLF